MQWIVRLGQAGSNQLVRLGHFGLFVYRTLLWLGPKQWSLRNLRLLLPQFHEVGYRSIPVVMITGVFVGLALAVQSIAQFKAVGLEDRLGLLINLSLVRELGPVLAGLMLAGRVGGAFTAELGTMKVTEQIDALRSMGADPLRYLVAPRFMACLLLTPILTFYCDLMGSIAGWLITVGLYDVPSGPYWEFTADNIAKWDLFTGILKSLFFGGTIGLIGCYKGFTCRHGAEGVGRACTESFVATFIVILALDFFIGYLLLAIYTNLWGFQAII